jgi:hypothetical protein
MVRCYAPRSFGVAQDDKVEKCTMRRRIRWGGSDNNKVGVFAYAKDFSTTAMPTLEMTKGERVRSAQNDKVDNISQR